MQNRYAQIQFIAANYSNLQGLKMVPIGILVIFSSLWATNKQGDLSGPIYSLIGTFLLYWLIDRYYANTFGRIKQTPKTRKWEMLVSILFMILALLAFWLDTALDLPFSVLGLVFAAALFESYWRATSSIKERSFSLYPETLLAAILILMLSLLPLTGLDWWKMIGMQSQVLGMLLIIGILLVGAGIWGHVRLIRALPVEEAKPDDISL
ncbi:MAG: hypothetical protein HY863_07810 [Chloroflexi bacterium]|nr:hypothetical protein [Chloroflexota bacterium]